MVNVVGVDIGFTQTKIAGDNWREKFLSVTKPREKSAVSAFEDAEGYLIQYGGGTFNVGSKGSYDFTADRVGAESSMPKLLAALGLYQYEYSWINDVFVVSGLPVMEFNTYRAAFKKMLSNYYSYSFNGIHQAVQVTSEVIPQSAGAFYAMILDERGHLIEDNELAIANVLVLDIGGKTTDGCIMEASKYSQDSFTIFQGVWRIQNELRKLIAREFKYTLKPYEVDAVLRSNTLMLGGKANDVEDLVNTAVDTIYPLFRDELTLHIEDFRRFDRVVLAGGGAYLSRLAGRLAAFVGIQCTVAEAAEFANAEGYRRYGLLMTNS